MFNLFFSIFWMIASPTATNNTINNNTQVTATSQANDDSSGETGHVPTKPPTNP